MTALAVAVVAWFAAGFVAAPRIGRRLHRNAHLHGEPRTDWCPTWCLQQQADRITRHTRKDHR